MRKILTAAIILLLTVQLFAANEIRVPYKSGSDLYAQIGNPVDCNIWDANSGAWADFNSADWADYNTPLTDCGWDLYKADFPTGITDAGEYIVNIYLRAVRIRQPATACSEAVNLSGTAAPKKPSSIQAAGLMSV